MHPLLSASGEPPTKFKKRGLTGSHILEETAGKEGGDPFQKGWREGRGGRGGAGGGAVFT